MKIIFHTFTMGDVEDPEIYAADPIMRWQETEQGHWVMKNAYDLTYHQQVDTARWGHQFIIRGELTDPKKITEYYLRWPKQDES